MTELSVDHDLSVDRDARLCPVCASRVPSGNGFCGACGTRMPASESTATEDALIGRVVDGRFRILELLGSGGMGAVYLAEHVGIGKRVAVKVLRADLRGHADLVGRFRREAMAVSKLTDAHTITVFDFGVWKGLVYLVMEYLRGTDLADVLNPDLRMEPLRAFRVAHQICSSLAEAHAVGVVHRDLKPENIFLTRTTSGDELVKVLDFGLAKIVAGDHPGEIGFETQDGALLGTPYYMAPEQIDGGEIEARTDLYSLGALLFRMLTGRVPYRGTTPMRVLEAHLLGDPPTFAQAAPDLVVPAEAEALVRRLLSRERANRPGSALEVDEVLQRLIEAVAPTTSQPLPAAPPVDEVEDTRPEPPRFVLAKPLPDLDETPEPAPTRAEFERYERRLRNRARLRWAALLLLVAGGGAAAWYATAGRPEPPPVEEVEPNDDTPEATRMRAGTPIRGFIGRRSDPSRSDRDVFVVRVPPDRPAAHIELTGVPGMDVLYEGFNAEGEALFKQSVAGVGEGERGVHSADVDRLYLVVREVWVQGRPPSENSTDPYTLTVRFEAPPAAPAPDAR